VVLLLAALVGCGRVGFDDRFDGGSGSDATADARIDASFTSRHWVNRGAGAPGILFAPKLVYHPIRRTVVMYGGGGGITPNIVSDEMWEWDGTTWTQLCTNCAPGGRRYHAMTYDSGRDRIVLFGGRPGGVELDDLWEWDGTTWTERTPSGTRPSGRAGAQLGTIRIANASCSWVRASADAISGSGTAPRGQTRCPRAVRSRWGVTAPR